MKRIHSEPDMHPSMTKQALREQVEAFGADLLNPRWSKEDALRFIERHPHEYIVLGGCDNVGPDGRCQGHT
jgi:hypothetical protein